MINFVLCLLAIHGACDIIIKINNRFESFNKKTITMYDTKSGKKKKFNIDDRRKKKVNGKIIELNEYKKL